MTRVRKQGGHHRAEAPVATGSGQAGGHARRWLIYWIAVTALALLFRVGLITAPLLPANPLPVFAGMLYPGDHDDFVRWGMQATDRGVLSLYDEAPARHDMRVWDKREHRWGTTQRKFDRICNYPPLSVYLLYASGLVFRAISGDRLINTPPSLATFEFWGILGDFLVAWGCAALVALFRPGWASRLAYALVLFLPPLWWDSVVWAQMDSVLLAPAVWMLYAMLRGRWLWAGVLWGIAFGLKPQAILFVPLWGLALLVVRPLWRTLAGGLATAAVLLVCALPFTLHSGWEWLRRSYIENLFSTYTHLTTLKAFNVWYLHLLLGDSIDARAAWLGIARGTWGKLFLLGGLLASFGFTIWRWGHARRGFVLWTTISLLLFVMLPTEVHERYLILVLPFLGVAAALTWRMWPGLVLLLIVTMAQVSWPLWLRTGRGQWPEIQDTIVQTFQQEAAAKPGTPEQKKESLERILATRYQGYRELHQKTETREWTFTLCALVGTASILAAFLTCRPEPAPRTAPSRRTQGRDTALAR
jgi:hypothetical protein